ncbi:hypothetical protein ACFY2R_15485 [Micromonospora olivasterospora]|uniref:Uncharacterized protein n=1 Tax=Micromonospora olivasterospora TaxID=1880 RepID=A0A562I4Q2_MICOL|nr:hypothetical protein [Micromonospora olivasterospora]TWH65980.1 hypothetical protein JD77_00923 [Micromonospora olivasterospora]
MLTIPRRQAGLTALYLGIFATIWFSVPAAHQPLRALLMVASVASLATAAVGGVVAARSRPAAEAVRDRAADRRYVLIVLAEFAAAGVGAALLAAAGLAEYAPVLVCGVVGLHFLPLTPVLKDPRLRLLGGAMCLVALAGLVTALASAVPAGLVVGVGAGLLLWAYALLALVTVLRPPQHGGR